MNSAKCPHRFVRASALTAAIILATVTSQEVAGYSYFTSTSGTPIVWPNNHAVRYLSASTFPVGATTSDIVHEAMGLWSIVPGSEFGYLYQHLSDDPTPDHFDGYSDTYAVSASSLDPGVLAVTYVVSNTTTGQLIDADLAISDYPDGSGWNFDTAPSCEIVSNPAENGYSLLLVLTHELGHGAGLGHTPTGTEPAGTSWFIATMNPAYPSGGPVGDSNIVELHADDRNGMRFLYPGSPETMTDLANTAYCTAGPQIGKAISAFIDPPAGQPGDQPQAWSVVENFGTTNVSDVRQVFYLSADATINSDDTALGEIFWNFAPGDGFEFAAGFDVPDLPAGQYYLGSMLDDLDEVTEQYEDNNNVVYCEPFTVTQAAPIITPFSQIVVTCASTFTGPTPVVAYPVNMAPITWTIDNPQPGMTMDPNTGVITWPQPVKSPFVYEIDVRATNDAGTTTQTLSLGVQQATPQIETPLNQTASCGQTYTGPVPQLTAPDCMTPILEWSLLDGPDGMTIDSGSGAVQWPDTVPGPVPYTVTLRATNASGQGEITFLLDVESANGDLDNDGDIDLIDFAEFESCLTGPIAAPISDCICADFDSDNDVDLADFAMLQLSFTGQVIHHGACCLADGSCSEGSPLNCNSIGGTYIGDGTDCTTADCDGACCFYTGGCLQFSSHSCDTAGGTFQGIGSDCGSLTCPPTGQGACCLPDESCSLETPANCTALIGFFHGIGTACESVDCIRPNGACCHTDASCTEGDPADCINVGGTYMGDDTLCVASTCDGACCYSNGGCLELSQPDCDVTGGTFQGPATDCLSADCPVAPQGACCMPDESCTDQIESICSSSGGTYQGDDTTCVETDCTSAAQGACCLTDESCIETTPAACTLAGGIFTNTTISCGDMDCTLSEIGACLDPYDWSCIETSQAVCTATGLLFEGAETTCATAVAPEYLNDIAQATDLWSPGANVEMADDLVMTGPARGLTYYALSVYGGGGGAFDVTASIYNGCPGLGGSALADTTFTWNDVPDDGYVYDLSATLPTDPVVIPQECWMVVSFSTDEAGWIVAEQAEAGYTDDIYAQDTLPWYCYYHFGGPPQPHAGFAAVLQCTNITSPNATTFAPGQTEEHTPKTEGTSLSPWPTPTTPTRLHNHLKTQERKINKICD